MAGVFPRRPRDGLWVHLFRTLTCCCFYYSGGDEGLEHRKRETFAGSYGVLFSTRRSCVYMCLVAPEFLLVTVLLCDCLPWVHPHPQAGPTDWHTAHSATANTDSGTANTARTVQVKYEVSSLIAAVGQLPGRLQRLQNERHTHLSPTIPAPWTRNVLTCQLDWSKVLSCLLAGFNISVSGFDLL